MDDKESQQNRRVLAFLLIILDMFIGVLANIATNALPNALKPYLWLAWPALGVLCIVYVLLAWYSMHWRHETIVPPQQKPAAREAISENTPHILVRAPRLIQQKPAAREAISENTPGILVRAPYLILVMMIVATFLILLLPPATMLHGVAMIFIFVVGCIAILTEIITLVIRFMFKSKGTATLLAAISVRALLTASFLAVEAASRNIKGTPREDIPSHILTSTTLSGNDPDLLKIKPASDITKSYQINPRYVDKLYKTISFVDTTRIDAKDKESGKGENKS